MLLIGLTGNYGMGKSTVLSMFRNLSAETIDTDSIVATLLKKNEVLKKIKEHFGDYVFNTDGTLNKKMIAKLIFNNNKLRLTIEALLHTRVFKEINIFLKNLHNQHKVVIVELPLLFEKGYEEIFDKTITVFTKKENALKRLKEKGINKEDILLRLESQLSIEEKIKRSDFIIDNNGTLKQTATQVKKIYKSLSQELKDGDSQKPPDLTEKVS